VVIVNNTDGTNARRGKIIPYRRTKTAGAHKYDFGVQYLFLAFSPDLGKQNVPAIAQYLVFSEIHIIP
jgi:hypothetical protein